MTKTKGFDGATEEAAEKPLSARLSTQPVVDIPGEAHIPLRLAYCSPPFFSRL
jgi:hypothetical protein